MKAKDDHEFFLVNFWRGSIQVAKVTHQLRHAPSEILLRLDTYGRHTNPPGNPYLPGTIDGAHLHVYKEDYEDKVAFPLGTIAAFAGVAPTDMMGLCRRFLEYCSIQNIPDIQGSLI